MSRIAIASHRQWRSLTVSRRRGNDYSLDPSRTTIGYAVLRCLGRNRLIPLHIFLHHHHTIISVMWRQYQLYQAVQGRSNNIVNLEGEAKGQSSPAPSLYCS